MDKRSWKKKKATKKCHHCGKRKKGNPKVGYGVCHSTMREAVRERIHGKKLVKEWE